MKDSQFDESGRLAPAIDSDAAVSEVDDRTRTKPAIKSLLNMWQLIPLSNNEKQAIPLVALTLKPNRTMVLGRANDCDLVVGLKPISRRHAEITLVNDQLTIEDLGSANGTYINDNRISSGELKHGDCVRFENLRYQVVSPESLRNKKEEPARTPSSVEIKPTVNDAEGTAAKRKPVVSSRDSSSAPAVKDSKKDEAAAAVKEKSLELETKPFKPQKRSVENAVKSSESDATPTSKDKDSIVENKKPADSKNSAEKSFLTTPLNALEDSTILQAAKKDTDTQSLQIIHGYLLGLTPPIEEMQLALVGEKIRIGRDAKNDLVIAHKSVSSKHAELNYVDGQWRLDDLKSTNGSFINGEKITHTMIKPGQLINIGQIKLVYNLNSIQEESDAPEEIMNGGNPIPVTVKNYSAAGKPLQDKSFDHSQTENSAHKGYPRPGLVIALGVAISLLVISWLPRWLENILPEESMDSVRGLSEQISAEMSLEPLVLTSLWNNAQIPSNRSAATPAIGDLDQDNFAEVVIADAQGFLTVFQGKDGQKLLEVKLPNRIIAPPMLGDLDRDGQTDIVVADNGGNVHKLGGDGQLEWSSDKSLNLGSIIQRPLLVDVNQDEFLDVVVASPNLGLAALDGSREGWLLWQSKQLLKGTISTLPVIRDLNKDGFSDFVVTTDQGQVSAITVHQGQVNLLWQQQLDPIIFSAPTLVGSQRKERVDERVVVLTDQAELIALSGRTGSVKWRKSVGGYAFAALSRSDCNRDGEEDVLLLRYDGNILCIRGDNGAKLWQQDLYTSIQSSAGMIDLTLDGIDDLVITDTKGQLHILNGVNGEQLIESFSIPNADNFSASPVIGDINHSASPTVLMVSQNGLIHSYQLNRHSDRGRLHWSHFLADQNHGYRHQ